MASLFFLTLCLICAAIVRGSAPLEQGSDEILNEFNLSSSGLVHGTDNLELERYKERVKIVHQMLREECSGFLRFKRENLSSQIESAHGEVERLLFERMVRMLSQCRHIKASNSTTTTTTPIPTVPPPSECLTATNLTEDWRKDHTGQSVGGESNCDLRNMESNRPWFRFSGAAGTQLLNTCPPEKSCGTHAGLWSYEIMPVYVGIPLNITVYGSYSNNCISFSKPVTVLRCSPSYGDFIYRFVGSSYCNLGFCSMD